MTEIQTKVVILQHDCGCLLFIWKNNDTCKVKCGVFSHVSPSEKNRIQFMSGKISLKIPKKSQQECSQCAGGTGHFKV